MGPFGQGRAVWNFWLGISWTEHGDTTGAQQSVIGSLLDCSICVASICKKIETYLNIHYPCFLLLNGQLWIVHHLVGSLHLPLELESYSSLEHLCKLFLDSVVKINIDLHLTPVLPLTLHFHIFAHLFRAVRTLYSFYHPLKFLFHTLWSLAAISCTALFWLLIVSSSQEILSYAFLVRTKSIFQ